MYRHYVNQWLTADLGWWVGILKEIQTKGIMTIRRPQYCETPKSPLNILSSLQFPT